MSRLSTAWMPLYCRVMREEFEETAVQVFGPEIKNFSRIPFRPPFDEGTDTSDDGTP